MYYLWELLFSISKKRRKPHCASTLHTQARSSKAIGDVLCQRKKTFIYRTRAIITRGLYTFYPLFEVEKRFFKGLFS